MSRITFVPFSLTTTTTCDFLELLPADDKPCRIRGFVLGQTTELAEAQEEVLDIRLLRFMATVTSGSGGADPVEFGADSADALSATLEVNNTTIATTSGATHELRFPWQLRNTPLEFWFPSPEASLLIKGAEGGFLRLAAAPADSTAFAGFVCVEEL